MWVQKYRPKHFNEIVGNQKVIQDLKGYNWKKPLLIHGAAGVGKSVLVDALASELGFELVEITDENIEQAESIAQTGSIFGGRKLLFIDNVDRIRDIRAVTEFLGKINAPVVLITSDFKSKRLATIKRSCEDLQIRKPTALVVAKILEVICKKEKIHAEKEILAKIAENAEGDPRAAINDLETVAKGKEKIAMKDLEILEYRDTKSDIYKALNTILRSDDREKIVNSTWDLDEELRDVLLWVDENVPRVYGGDNEAFHNLSRADVFLGRIQKRQYWGFQRYANVLMTLGVNIRKPERIGFVQYQFPRYIAKLGQTKKERALKKSIGQKLAPKLHLSQKTAALEYIPLFRELVKHKKTKADELKEFFKLEPEELEFITG